MGSSKARYDETATGTRMAHEWHMRSRCRGWRQQHTMRKANKCLTFLGQWVFLFFCHFILLLLTILVYDD